MIRQAVKSDAASIASLIYQTDDHLFPFLFGNKFKALIRLEKLVKREHNQFSFQNTWVEEDGRIRGILIDIDPHTRLSNARAFFHAFGTIGLIGLFFRQLLLFPALRLRMKHDRYIQNIVIDPDFRGKGLGSALLDDAIARALKDGIKILTLDVARNNPGAIKLYERVGFQAKLNKRVWFLFPILVRMEKDLLDQTQPD